MKLKIIIGAIGILLLVLIGSAVLLSSGGSKQKEQKAKPSIAPQNLPNAGTTIQSLSNNPKTRTALFILPNPIDYATSNNATGSGEFTVNIDTSTNAVAKVQIELSFDPNILGNVTIQAATPSGFFPNPTVLLQQVNQTNGTLFFVVENASGFTKGEGVVANVTFTVLPTAEKETAVRFLPKTQTFAKDIAGSSLFSTVGTTILLSE